MRCMAGGFLRLAGFKFQKSSVCRDAKPPALRYGACMWEFAGRWVAVMTLAAWALGLAKGGGAVRDAPVWDASAGGVSEWGVSEWQWMAGLWVGFWNALLRPLVLRFGMEGPRVIGLMGAAVFAVNAVLFYELDAWVPVLGVLDGSARLVVGTASALVSWGLSSVFHSHDRRWHWITYHGAVQRARDRRDRRDQQTTDLDEDKQP
jgi:hypothetical protein